MSKYNALKDASKLALFFGITDLYKPEYKPVRKTKKLPNPSRKYSPFSDKQKMINKMTNWQRHQWRKAGYPGLKSGNLQVLEQWTKLEKVKQ